MSLSTGNQGATLVKERYGADRQSGPFYEQFWEGTKQAIIGKIPEVAGTASTYSTDHNGPRWNLTARWNYDPTGGVPETPQREERVHWNRSTKSIFSAPRYNSLTSAMKRFVKHGVDNNDETFNDVNDDLANLTPTSDQLNLCTELFDLATSGQESIIIEQPIVIITQTASSAYAWTPNFNFYGYIYTLTQMVNEAGLISGWIGNLPQQAGVGILSYGYLKSPPEITTTGDNRSQLVQQFEYGLWPTSTGQYPLKP